MISPVIGTLEMVPKRLEELEIRGRIEVNCRWCLEIVLKGQAKRDWGNLRPKEES